MDRKDIFMSGFKSKIGYSFTYKDLAEFEAIIDFYENKSKSKKEVIGKAINWIIKYQTEWCQEDEVIRDLKQLLDILKEVPE